MLPLPAFLLALAGGNVTASINSTGDLVLVGDAQDNVIRFENDYVRALGGTTINGATHYFPPPISGGWIVDLGAGADQCSLSDVAGPDKVVVNLGDGSDRFGAGLAGAGSLTVLAGAGDDRVHIEDCDFNGIEAQLGDGADDFEIAWTSTRDLRVDAGSGNDEVRLRFGYFEGPVRARGGTGRDRFTPLGDNAYLFSLPRLSGFEGVLRPR